ncbi:A disintegrin and metalloproteinase with thrombospondin motifs 9-like [Pecten maximus]|uniref:A disintegrin and metalloproteinase with thrombospondin motifs 9-like n=1 Tax=Pecten maximus TaxID=6579 RepID=UPI00145912D7|nr:A disintegrin and metalloproteinase with thrombospondin motifs 9-like [Pecten maximus]
MLQDLPDCHEVKACNRQYEDGEYFIYPRALGGRKVKVFCSGMAGPDPKEYVTLHNTNTGTYNYSLRTDNDYCTFRDRVGDAVSTFRKIRLDVQDMSVQRYDFTYADIMEEDPNVWKPPKYGAGGGCTWDYVYRNYRNCIAPGGFVIDTSGTGLIVDPELQWMSYGYGGRLETVYRSNNNAHVTAACDGWCAWCFPVGEMILQLEPAVGLIGDATEPMCV